MPCRCYVGDIKFAFTGPSDVTHGILSGLLSTAVRGRICPTYLKNSTYIWDPHSVGACTCSCFDIFTKLALAAMQCEQAMRSTSAVRQKTSTTRWRECVVEYVTLQWSNMSTSYSLAFLAVVICLSLILLASESDAQSTIDESESCGASTLEEVTGVVTREFKEVRRKNVKEFEDVKTILNEVKNLLTSTQDRPCANANQSEEVTIVMARDLKEIKEQNAKEFKEMKNLLASTQERPCVNAKQTFVSALVGEYLHHFIQLYSLSLSLSLSLSIREHRSCRDNGFRGSHRRCDERVQRSKKKENVKEFEDVKTILNEAKNLLTSTQDRPCANANQSLVTALTCKYLVSFHFSHTILL